MNNYIQETYKNEDSRVITFISRVYDDCVKNNENLSNYFYCCLDLLCVQLKLYYMALDALNTEKTLASEDNYKRIAKSPHIMILNKSHQEILNILQKLSLSPFEKAKLKRLNNSDDAESAEALYNNLIN